MRQLQSIHIKNISAENYLGISKTWLSYFALLHFTPIMSAYPLVLILSHLRYAIITNSGPTLRMQLVLLMAATFPMHIYPLTGGEGSATDAILWQDAQQKGLAIPEGKYFLGDAGFSETPEILTPYCGVQYHLAEWGCAQLRYVNLI